jgi:hypothetical protein
MKRLVSLAIASVLIVSAAFAETKSANAPSYNSVPDTSLPHVVWVIAPNNDLSLGERLIVGVKNFDALLAETGGNCRDIVLFLDTMPMKGLQPESCNKQRGTVRFIIKRTEDSDKAWHSLLGSPTSWKKSVDVSVGPNEQFAVATTVRNFPLWIVPKGRFGGFILLLLGCAVTFYLLCKNTAMIRGGSGDMPTLQRPFSLARWQMAFWFFLVILGYIFVWMITGELDTITESILALIGIGAGTALGAALIETKPSGANASPNAPPQTSRGFIRDLLDDGNGVSLHRFQMFVWTIVLGIIFCDSVYRDLSMPQFSATLLGLMGISSGTYLGFKFPEQAAKNANSTAEPSA